MKEHTEECLWLEVRSPQAAGLIWVPGWLPGDGPGVVFYEVLNWAHSLFSLEHEVIGSTVADRYEGEALLVWLDQEGSTHNIQVVQVFYLSKALCWWFWQASILWGQENPYKSGQ